MKRATARLVLGALSVAAAAVLPSAASRADAGLKFINVHGDPDIILTLTPSYLPDGKVVDLVHLVNRSDRDYCFRFEVHDDAWIYVPKKVNIVTAPPGSAYEVARVKIIAAGGRYRYKIDGKYLADTGIKGRDCRKAFPGKEGRTRDE
ncbi:MAG TPA: hypothetical protein VEA15_05225 [Caulobacteraceae bacterium]|nr:hypothetical protein [Caulobacteraceae bacterium]